MALPQLVQEAKMMLVHFMLIISKDFFSFTPNPTPLHTHTHTHTTGTINEDYLREILTTFGDRFSHDDVDDMYKEAPIK